MCYHVSCYTTHSDILLSLKLYFTIHTHYTHTHTHWHAQQKAKPFGCHWTVTPYPVTSTGTPVCYSMPANPPGARLVTCRICLTGEGVGTQSPSSTMQNMDSWHLYPQFTPGIHWYYSWLGTQTCYIQDTHTLPTHLPTHTHIHTHRLTQWCMHSRYNKDTAKWLQEESQLADYIDNMDWSGVVGRKFIFFQVN